MFSVAHIFHCLRVKIVFVTFDLLSVKKILSFDFDVNLHLTAIKAQPKIRYLVISLTK